MENKLGMLNAQADLIGSEHTAKEWLNGHHEVRANGVLYTTHTGSYIVWGNSAGLKVRTRVLGQKHALKRLSSLTSVHLSGPERDPKMWSQILQCSY